MGNKYEDLNIQIQYKLIEELKKTNEDLQLKIKDEQAIGNKLKSTVAHLNLVNEFAQLIQKANNTSDIVWAITENAISKLGFEDCVIYLINEEGNNLIQVAAYGHKNPNSREIFNPVKIKIGEGIVGTVAKTGISEIISNTKKDSRYIVDDIPRLSEITVPIIYNEKVIGVIDSEHSKENFYNQNHLEILTTIGAMAGTKIIQAQLNENLINHQKDLELIIKKRTDEINLKNKDLKKQNSKLYKMALFPAHNPNPVVELDFNLNVIYHNEACKNHPSIYSLITENHKELDKFQYLLKETIKSKKDGKYTVKEGIKIDGKHYNFNIYIDKKHNFIRLYLNDMTESILLQEELKKQRDEIYDSLNYAKNIQQSILPEEKLFYPFFKNQFFYFNPKDIVSGDFYWAREKDNQLYFALCDCTGHGVPGALLSMIGYDALNYVINNDKISSSKNFMNGLSEFFKNARQSGRLRHNDSMDLILFKYDPKNKSICYSGSNQKLFIIRNNDLLEYNTDHINLGEDFESVNNTFTEQCIKLTKGDVIYAFSDGYVDQFGGLVGKKLKYPKFRKLLLEIHKRPMNQQPILLDEYIEEWKNECINDPFPQIDDMTVVGFKI